MLNTDFFLLYNDNDTCRLITKNISQGLIFRRRVYQNKFPTIFSTLIGPLPSIAESICFDSNAAKHRVKKKSRGLTGFNE